MDGDFDLAEWAPRERSGPCKLYLISPQDVGGDFPDRLRSVVGVESVAAFQLRVKNRSDHDIARLAEPLQRICSDVGVAFIVNDSVALAKRLGADGVHLGQADGVVGDARTMLGPSAQIGVTCHDSRHLAMEAGEAGADYVAFGAFYPTETKRSDFRPDPSILSWWSNLFEIPCVAIGGITPGNATKLIEHGADFIAVCGAIWDSSEPRKVALDFNDLLLTHNAK